LNDNAAITGVAISFDGVSYGNAVYGVARPDVCLAYPKRAGCPNVGWGYLLDTTLLANGSHTDASDPAGAMDNVPLRRPRLSLASPGRERFRGRRAGEFWRGDVGPNASALQDLQSKGFDKWFAEQAAAPVSTFADQAR